MQRETFSVRESKAVKKVAISCVVLFSARTAVSECLKPQIAQAPLKDPFSFSLNERFHSYQHVSNLEAGNETVPTSTWNTSEHR